MYRIERRPAFHMATCFVFAVIFFHCSWIPAQSEPSFAKDVLPILTNKCFRCHGPDEETLESGLRLDSFEHATREADSGSPAIVPGDFKNSELWVRVSSSDVDLRMPPEGAGKPLNAAELRIVRDWIQSGARYDKHWGFELPRRPKIGFSDWTKNGIDYLVERRLKKMGLKPARPATRHLLIRRLSLDLTGLPATLDEVDTFVNDDSPESIEKLVDRLLASPTYGERWARIWLDLARYADSAGYAQDPLRNIWRYRDWVIDAINQNMPFDQFTIEQLAGDLLEDPSQMQRLATAFHRNTMTNSEGGTDNEEFRNAAVIDRVNTTMQVWMGLTMACAQCHSHKYDPISQEEYYRFFAVFNNTADADRPDESPLLAEYDAATRKRLADLQKARATIQALPENDESKEKKLSEIDNQIKGLPKTTTPIFRELPSGKRRETHVQVRGNFRVKGEQVSPGVPSAFHPLLAERADRLAIANWLMDPANPLTARVTVNRIWEQFFGIGLVETSEDFGLQGMPPSHPELLDFLATELIRLRWDTKKLAKLIVMSATYQQSAAVSEELAQRDPRNRLLARGPRFRLPAEMIRDQALAISGLLSTKMHGPSVQPVQPKLGLRSAFGGTTDWEPSRGEDRFRRGLYTQWRRTTPYPSMITFDAPSREVCTVRRIATNTPLQALVTLNDPVFVEASQSFARRILREGPADLEGRIRMAMRACLARHPSALEVARIEQLFHQLFAKYQNLPREAKLIGSDPIGPIPPNLDQVELAAWTVIANVLLNLDEVLARP